MQYCFNTVPLHSINYYTYLGHTKHTKKMQKFNLERQTNSDLIAIVTGKNVDAVRAAIGNASLSEICKNVEFYAEKLGKPTVKKLTALFELNKRKEIEVANKIDRITCSDDAYRLIKNELNDLPHEEFWVMGLNQNNKVIYKERVSAGGISSVVVDMRIIFRMALQQRAVGVILCHNHPSGSKKQSSADMDITRKCVAAGKVLEIAVLDHIIVASNGGYLSFADEGLL